MAVSQKQIAERLGVSIALVSRVLSGRAQEVGIAEATIEKVLAVADELGYVPSAAALTLKGKSTHTIGVVVYDFKDPYFGAVIEELQAQAHEHDYSLVLAGFKKRTPEASDLAPLNKHAIDGLIILGSADEAEWLKAFQDMPVARIGHSGGEEASVRICVDEDDAADQILGHLSSCSCSKPVFIGEHFLAHRMRFAALVNRAPEYRCAIRGITSASWAYAAGLDETKRLLAANDADAIICATDKIAMGALHAMHDAGRRLPVTGFDDIPAAAQFIPPITTLRQPFEQMAKMAFESVIHPNGNKEVHLKGTLMVRSSA
jgi:LacI family transcriptional regulator